MSGPVNESEIKSLNRRKVRLSEEDFSRYKEAVKHEGSPRLTIRKECI